MAAVKTKRFYFHFICASVEVLCGLGIYCVGIQSYLRSCRTAGGTHMEIKVLAPLLICLKAIGAAAHMIAGISKSRKASKTAFCVTVWVNLAVCGIMLFAIGFSLMMYMTIIGGLLLKDFLSATEPYVMFIFSNAVFLIIPAAVCAGVLKLHRNFKDPINDTNNNA